MRTTVPTTPVDAVTAIALAVGAQLEIWAPHLVPGVANDVADRPFLAVTSLAATLPLAVRRRFPLTVLGLVLGALVLQQVLSTPTEGLVLLVAAMVAAYSSSAFTTMARAWAAGVVIIATAAFIGQDRSDWAFVAVVLGAAWLLGVVVAQRSSELHRALADNADLAAQLASAAEKLVADEQAVATGSTSDGLPALTARELDVVREIAAGRSNAEIAAALFISEWTVKTHVASILRKLGLRDRAQVVVAAYESGYVRPGTSTA